MNEIPDNSSTISEYIKPNYVIGDDLDLLKETHPEYTSIIDSNNKWVMPLELIKLQKQQKGDPGWNRDLYLANYRVSIETLYNSLSMKFTSKGILKLIPSSSYIMTPFGGCTMETTGSPLFKKINEKSRTQYLCTSNKPPVPLHPKPLDTRSNISLMTKLILISIVVLVLFILSFILSFRIFSKINKK